MIDNFKTELVLRAAAIPPEAILKAMGYQQPGAANFERLQDVLDSPEFGLSDSRFDFKYSSEGFLRALCNVTGMDELLTVQLIARTRRYLEEERSAFKPYLWVDTGFKRQSQTLISLAVLEHKRYVQFPKGFWRHRLQKQLSLAQNRVREHMYETGGNIGIWGDIQEYRFYHGKDEAYLLAHNGKVLGKRKGPVSNKASASPEIKLVTSSNREST